MMDRSARSPRKNDRGSRKQKKRKKPEKCTCNKRRPHKPEPGKYCSSPELSDAERFSGEQSAVYNNTLHFDPSSHFNEIEKAPKPLSDTLERLSKPRKPKATSITAPPSSTRSEPTLSLSQQITSFRTAQAIESRRNESLRWDYVESDEEKETERIRVYKINRRKRYLAASNRQYGSANNSSALERSSVTAASTSGSSSLPSSPKHQQISASSACNHCSHQHNDISCRHKAQAPSGRRGSSSTSSNSKRFKAKRVEVGEKVFRHADQQGGDKNPIETIQSSISEMMLTDFTSVLNHNPQNLPKVSVNV